MLIGPGGPWSLHSVIVLEITPGEFHPHGILTKYIIYTGSLMDYSCYIPRISFPQLVSLMSIRKRIEKNEFQAGETNFSIHLTLNELLANQLLVETAKLCNIENPPSIIINKIGR